MTLSILHGVQEDLGEGVPAGGGHEADSVVHGVSVHAVHTLQHAPIPTDIGVRNIPDMYFTLYNEQPAF